MFGKKDGNIPEIDKELERLKNLGIIENRLLSGLYGDLYGTDGPAPAGADGGSGDGTAGGPVINEEVPGAAGPGTEQGLDMQGGAASGTEASGTAESGTVESGAADSGTVESGVSASETAVSDTQAEEAPAKKEEDPRETLDQLIGLTKIKDDVKELTDFARIQKMRKDGGLKSVPVSLHLVFTGNPGTGKTTVARIIAKLYKQIGVLSKGQLIEVDRAGLVAGYVGQTALKTQEQIEKALGGVLFIDEAYALAQKDDAFGQEAIDTILKAMEDHRDDLVVIVAGYTKPMEKFINSNPGLKSRFNKYIEFPDYSVDELMAIFELNCKKYDYRLEEDTAKHVREMIVLRKLQKTENFANAREVRNLFEEISTNQARRVAALESPGPEDMMLITMDDLYDPEMSKSGGDAPDGAAGETGAECRETPRQTEPECQETPRQTEPECGDNSGEEEKKETL